MSNLLPNYLFAMLFAAALAFGLASPARAVTPLHFHNGVAPNTLVQAAHWHHRRHHHHHHH